MYGEDASGRKVSLLNGSDNTSTFTSTAKSPTGLFLRPTLPLRSRDLQSSSSSGPPSREGSNKSSSSHSSSSCSPRQSPPTPPLVRLDSRSSIQTITTPSPMTPPYHFDPLETPNFDKIPPGSLPYYPNGYHQQNGEDNGGSYPPLQNPNHQTTYYSGMNAQQHLPPMYGGMSHAYPHHPNLHLQTAGLPQYPTTHPIHPLALSHPPQTVSCLATFQPNQSHLPITTPHQIEPTPATPPTPSTVTSAKPDHPVTAIGSNTATTLPTKSSTNAAGSAPAAGTPASLVPKKKYNCPHAKEYKCNDTFTTSGHAARHGKKHTGEKNVNCPTCGKAFTRKDNMKQHERTHKPGHSTRRTNSIESPVIAGGVGLNKAKKRTMSGSTRASLASTSPSLALTANPDGIDDDEDADGDVDMDLARDPARTSATTTSAATTSTAAAAAAAAATPTANTKMERPPLGKTKLSEILEQVNTVRGDIGMVADGDADGDGESPGLDALATVAAEEMGAQFNR